MLTKIDAIYKQRKVLSTWALSELKKTWRDNWSQHDYLIGGDIHESVFKGDYDAYIKQSQRWLTSAQEIFELHELLIQLEKFPKQAKQAKKLQEIFRTSLEAYDIQHILASIRKHISLEKLKKTLGYLEKKEELLSPFEYSSSFAIDQLSIIIREFMILGESSWSKELKNLEAMRNDIQSKLHQITTSLKKISSYKYIPFESLDSAINRTISLSKRTGERWVIRKLLSRKIEKKYTQQYEFAISQIWAITSWWRRQVSGWSDILADLISGMGNTRARSSWFGGWRSLGGGSSFGWWWSSSWWTSW